MHAPARPRTPSLVNRHLLPPRQLRHLHPEFTPEDLLRGLKHSLELPTALLAEHLGADIGPPDRET